jgi:hypothetical protein
MVVRLDRERARALADRVDGRAHLVQHRQQQVRHRRVRRVADVPAAPQPSRGAARQQHRQRVEGVLVVRASVSLDRRQEVRLLLSTNKRKHGARPV